jgi:hypothetical protein
LKRLKRLQSLSDLTAHNHYSERLKLQKSPMSKYFECLQKSVFWPSQLVPTAALQTKIEKIDYVINSQSFTTTRLKSFTTTRLRFKCLVLSCLTATHCLTTTLKATKYFERHFMVSQTACMGLPTKNGLHGITKVL